MGKYVVDACSSLLPCPPQPIYPTLPLHAHTSPTDFVLLSLSTDEHGKYFDVTAYPGGEAAFYECIPTESFAQWWGPNYWVFTSVMQALNFILVIIVARRLAALMYGMKKKAGEEYYQLWWSNSVAHNYIFISICVLLFPLNLLDVDGFYGWFDSFAIDLLLEIRTSSMIYVLLRSIFSWVATLSSKGARPKLSDTQAAMKYTLISMAWCAPFWWIAENFGVDRTAYGILNAYWGATKLMFVAVPAFLGTAGSES